MIKKFALTLAVAGSLAAPVGCTQTEGRNAAIGAAGGAVAGQLIGGDTRSTVGGAIIGATAGVLVANRRNDQGECLYRLPDGRTYYDTCPRR